MIELSLQGSGPINLFDFGNPLFADGTIEKFEATEGAGHNVATGEEDGVNQVVRTHLALLFLLQDLPLLQRSPCSHPVFEANPAKREHLLDLLARQPGKNDNM